MKKNIFILAIVAVSVFFVSCNNNKSSDEDDVNYNPALVAKDNLKAYKKAAKLARKQMRDLENQEERTWNYIDTAQNLADKEEESQKKTELKEKNCGGCGHCQQCVTVNNIFNWPAPPVAAPKALKAPRALKASKPKHICLEKVICPTCPETPAPEKVKEEVEKASPEAECDCKEQARKWPVKTGYYWKYDKAVEACRIFKSDGTPFIGDRNTPLVNPL